MNVLWALPLLLFTGVLLPLMALASRRRLMASDPGLEESLSTASLTLQALAVQIPVFFLAWLAASGTGIELSWRASVTPVTLLVTVAIVAGGLALAWLEGRRPRAANDALRQRLRQISPVDPAWLLVSVVAAVTEEFAYRGVLTLVLTPFLGFPLAAVVSALLFGLAHVSQGVLAVLGGALLGLLFQGLVQVSGGLALAMVAHLAYDLGAAWLGRRLSRRAA